MPQNEYQLDQLQTSLLTIAAACVGLIAVAVLLRSAAAALAPARPPDARTARRRRGRDASAAARRWSISTTWWDTRGTTTTQLTPSGKARFGDLLVDVIADGEVIDRGAAIEVVEVRGSRVLVQEVGRD